MELNDPFDNERGLAKENPYDDPSPIKAAFKKSTKRPAAKAKTTPSSVVDELDEFEAAEKAAAIDELDAFEAGLSQQIPLSPERQEKVDRRIADTSLPFPSKARLLADSFSESNRAVGQQLADRTLFGAPGRALRAIGQFGEPVQPVPGPINEASLANLPAAAIDMATLGGAFGRAGQTVGQAPATLARSLGAKQAQTVARPSLQSAANAIPAGALYSGADTAMRGGDAGEVLASMPEGALAAGLMSQIAPVAKGIADFAKNRVAANDLRPVKQMSKKGTLDKELIQFGNGDPEEGAREMVKFVQRENLGPILRQKGSKAIEKYEAAKDAVWENDLKPIYDHAKAVEPGAAVPFDEIASRLRSSIRARGGNEHRLIEKAIDEIKARSELVGKSGDVPLDTLLTNARDFQSAGHAGVVNYDSPPQSKNVMRSVGHTLRQMANERVARVYERNPTAAQELFTGEPAQGMGVTFRNQPSTPGMVRSEDYPNAWARRYENYQDYASDVPRKLAEGNKRYSDYAKLEPLVRESSKLAAGEKKHGLINLVGHGITGGLSSLVGYSVGGVPGAVAAPLLTEGARATYPYAVRGAGSLAEAFAGPPVQGGVAGAMSLKPMDERRD